MYEPPIQHEPEGSGDHVRDPSGKGATVLIIPVYQPSADLLALISEVFERDEGQVLRHAIVVDDGSSSEHRALFDRLSSTDRVTVLRHAVNLGKGAALKTAFNIALLRWPDAVGFVTADADGQHAPVDILRVASALAGEPDKLILGTRRFGRSTPFRSLLGNWVTRLIFRVFSGFSVTDTQTGLRGWPAALCKRALAIPVNGYEFELANLLNPRTGRSRRIAVREVPIQTIYLDGNASSHFNPLWDSMRIYFVFLRYCSSSLATAATDYVTFMAVLSRSNSIGLAQTCGRTLAVLVSYYLGRNLVFRSRSAYLVSFSKFVLLVAVMGVVSYSMIDLLHGTWGLEVIEAKLVAEGVLFFGNFSIQRSFVFARSDAD